MSQVFDIGDTARLAVTFTDMGGAVADPTAVTLRVLSPSGGESSPTIDHDAAATGEYTALLSLTAAGTWRWRWQGTGTVGAASEGTIAVRASAFT